MKLNQLFNEGIGPRTLYHYTSYSSLVSILESGKIRARKYPGTPEGTVQIATVRPSMANDTNIKQLSDDTTGGVRFIFNGEVLSDSIRDVKIRNIAELPAFHYEELLALTKFKESKLDDVIHSLENSKNKKITLLNFNVKPNVIDNFIHIYNEYKKYIVNREGEERITIKSNSNIDFLNIKSKFVKIELLKPFPSKTIIDYKQKLIKLIKLNKEFFIDNKIYRDLIED